MVSALLLLAAIFPLVSVETWIRVCLSETERLHGAGLEAGLGLPDSFSGCCGFAIAPSARRTRHWVPVTAHRPGPRLNPRGICLLCTHNEPAPQDTPSHLSTVALALSLLFAADANPGSLCGESALVDFQGLWANS